MQKATFGAGCFWGVEETFRKVKGVKKTTVGYMGGNIKNPSYEQVCSGTTGHIEVLQIEFDPKISSYDQLLDIFWKCHDPTSMDKQGPDRGIQYRSVIFFYTQEQKTQALRSKELQEKRRQKKMVTQILPATEFYKAEEYHQQYLKKKGLAVCHF